MKMLIVENTLIHRETLKQLLMPHGEVQLAEDGVEGVEAFCLAHASRNPYDLIFMDIMMPNMDGHQAVQAIRSKERELDIPTDKEAIVIMLTTQDDPKGIMQAYFLDGCTQYINKPITQDKLNEVFQLIGGNIGSNLE